MTAVTVMDRFKISSEEYDRTPLRRLLMMREYMAAEAEVSARVKK